MAGHALKGSYSVMIRLRAVKIIIIAAVMLIIPLCSASPAGGVTGSDEMMIRQQLISLLQNGSSLESIPANHVLYPLKKIPSLATVSYLMLGDDPAMLERFYPAISSYVNGLFAEGTLTETGFVPGSGFDDDISISPSINAFANIELHALSLIAFSIGRYEEALELRSWSRQYARAVSRTFYDHTRDSFYPISGSGYYLVEYAPEFLLPMVLDPDMNDATRRRIADRALYNMTAGRSGTDDDSLLWDNLLLRPYIVGLLSSAGGFPAGRLEAFAELPSHRRPGHSPSSQQRAWVNIWQTERDRCSMLFPSRNSMLSLETFILLMERESLLEKEDLEKLKSSIAKISEDLESEQGDIETYSASISHVNGLLAEMGSISTQLHSGEKLWRIINENTWRIISPRSKRAIKQSASESIEELMQAKVVLSRSFMDRTGLVASVILPDKPVPIGSPIGCESYIRNSSSRMEIERVYLQIAGNRWKITGEDEKISLTAGGNPHRWTRNLNLPPGTETGIMSFPYFFDFMHEGKRVEIHDRVCLTLTRGFDISLNFPQGKRLKAGRPTDVNIILKYRSESRIQGIVDGVLLGGLRSSPELPARFAVEAGSVITTLPVSLQHRRDIAPGIYPLSLSVSLDGRTVASFEEKLVYPFRWLHLGPISNRRLALENAVEFQDDLYGSYDVPDGRLLRWREVPTGAIDPDGAVLPDRLYGSGSDMSMLLYTVVTVPSNTKVKWQLESINISSLWINSTEIISSVASGGVYSGTVMLRKGDNYILVASAYPQSPHPVHFSMMDDAGLPVPDLANNLDKIFSGSSRLASLQAVSPSSGGGTKEVFFQLNYPEASEISLIAEFNNWSPEVNPMRRNANGKWTIAVVLPTGRYQYKFLIDKKLKITDPGNSDVEPDGFGGLNSVITVK